MGRDARARRDHDEATDRFLTAYRTFIDDHDACPDGPDHMRMVAWIPRGQLEASVRFRCLCGVEVTLPAPQRAAKAIVAACRLTGMAVEEHTDADGIH